MKLITAEPWSCPICSSFLIFPLSLDENEDHGGRVTWNRKRYFSPPFVRSFWYFPLPHCFSRETVFPGSASDCTPSPPPRTEPQPAASPRHDAYAWEDRRWWTETWPWLRPVNQRFFVRCGKVRLKSMQNFTGDKQAIPVRTVLDAASRQTRMSACPRQQSFVLSTKTAW